MLKFNSAKLIIISLIIGLFCEIIAPDQCVADRKRAVNPLEVLLVRISRYAAKTTYRTCLTAGKYAASEASPLTGLVLHTHYVEYGWKYVNLSHRAVMMMGYSGSERDKHNREVNSHIIMINYVVRITIVIRSYNDDSVVG